NRTVPFGLNTVTVAARPASLPTANGCPAATGGGGGGGGGGGRVSLSRMVRVAEAGVPRPAPPVGPDSDRPTVSFPSTAVSSMIVTVNVLAAASPSAQLSVPDAPA